MFSKMFKKNKEKSIREAKEFLLSSKVKPTKETASAAMLTLLNTSKNLQEWLKWNNKLFTKYESLIASNNLFQFSDKELKENIQTPDLVKIISALHPFMTFGKQIDSDQLFTHCLLKIILTAGDPYLPQKLGIGNINIPKEKSEVRSQRLRDLEIVIKFYKYLIG